ncbi:selenocysteine-specific elongation factor-like [Oncorhynchus mykiss]|uniref:selenocysteine-specific elongation factor-like n=1 Tax=Oncorhynchus mykiss TaxID=8022 RepID=UPI0018776C90|nr:selenocysteine-specific elongation factor-like [Oncorhynchus mykiss]
MVVILNKTDLLQPNKRQTFIDKMTKRLHKTLENTRFKDCPVIAVAAKPGGPEAPETEEHQGVPDLMEVKTLNTLVPQDVPALLARPGGALLMAVHHCFSSRGQGTVMTGTILQGALAVNDTVEIPDLELRFRCSGSRCVGPCRVTAWVCVTQFGPKLLERGVVCTPGSLHTLHAAHISVRKIGHPCQVPHHRGPRDRHGQGHLLRSAPWGDPPRLPTRTPNHHPPTPTPHSPQPEPSPLSSPFSFDREYFHQDEYVIGQREAGGARPDPKQWALLEFERPVTCPPLCLVIGSKLDTDIHANACRLAFQGRLLEGFEEKSYSETTLPRLRIYKTKRKEGAVERRVSV